MSVVPTDGPDGPGNVYRLVGWIFAGVGFLVAAILMMVFFVVGAGSWPVLIPAAAIGIPFVGSGLGMVAYGRARAHRQAALRANGARVVGTITSFLATGSQIAGEMLQKAVVRGDDGRRYLSDGFQFSKTDWEVGDRVLIYVSQSDPQKYLVDVAAGGPQDLRRAEPQGELESGDFQFPQLPVQPDDEDA